MTPLGYIPFDQDDELSKPEKPFVFSKSRSAPAANRVWLSIVFSYTLILLLPLMVYLAVFWRIQRSATAQINRYNMSMLKQFQLEADNVLRKANSFYAQLCVDPQVRSLLEIETEGQILDSFDSIKSFLSIASHLSSMQEADSAVEKYLIFSQRSGLIWYSSNVYSPELFFGARVSASFLDEATWNSVVELKSELPFRYSLSTDTANRELIAFKRELADGGKNVGSFVLLVLNQRMLRHAAEALDSASGSSTYIADERGIPLFSTKDLFNKATIPSLGGHAQDGYSTERIGGRLYTVYRYSSAVMPVTYVHFLPGDVSTAQSRFMSMTMILGFLFSLTAGIALIVNLSKRNYSPVRELVELVKSVPGVSSTSRNEYQLIKSTYLGMSESNKKLSERVAAQKRAIASRFLGHLLYGRVGRKDMEADTLTSLGLDFLGDRFLVLLCYIEMEQSPHDTADIDLDDVDRRNTHVLKESVGEDWDVYSADAEGLFAYVIGLPESALPSARDKMLAATSQLQTAAYSYTCAVSLAHRGIGSVPLCFREASDALEYRFYSGRRGTIFAEDIIAAERASAGYSYSFEDEEQIMNSLRLGDADRANAVIDRLMGSATVNGQLSLLHAKCLTYELFGTFLKVLSTDRRLLRESDPVALLQQQDGAPPQERLRAVVRDICALTADNRAGSEHVKLIQRIQEIIESRFREKTLDITSISQALDMNPKYVSSIYKGVTGESITETLHKRRLKEIKILFSESSIAIADAADIVGYSSIATLMRAFKRYEGITPGKFKELS